MNKNSDAKIKANAKYSKTHYEQINLPVPKGTRERWRQKATEIGHNSLRSFIIDAVEEKINRDTI